MKKRIWGLILTLAMLMSSVQNIAFAVDNTDEEVYGELMIETTGSDANVESLMTTETSTEAPTEETTETQAELPSEDSTIIASGTYEPNLIWSLNSDGTLTINGTLGVPLANITEPCTMIAVIYDENRAFVGFEEVEVNAGDTEKIINVTAENADSVKIFLWGDLLNMIPLCNSVEKQIQ